MTGKQLKEFAAQIPDNCVVEMALREVYKTHKTELENLRYSSREDATWVPVLTRALRVVIVPDVVLAEQAAERLTGGTP